MDVVVRTSITVQLDVDAWEVRKVLKKVIFHCEVSLLVAATQR